MEMILALETLTLKGIVQIIVLLAICGVAFYFARPYIDALILRVITVFIVIVCCLWLLQQFGLL